MIADETIDIKDIFLCHNSADKDWVRELGERIEAEPWGERRFSVFFDEWDIEPGENILLKLNKGLKESRFVAIVLSPEMLRSDWCALEYSSVLADDPVNRKGRLIPLLVRDMSLDQQERLDLPPILKPFNFVDFRRKADFSRRYASLLAKLKGEPPPRGRGRFHGGIENSEPLIVAPALRGEPDSVSEKLISNLLPIHSLPRTVFGAPTSLRVKGDVPKGTSLPPFILKENQLYAFADLSDRDSAFAPYINPTRSVPHRTVDWVGRPDLWTWLVELLNIALRSHLRKERVFFDRDSKRYFFLPKADNKSLVLRWGSGTKRTVVRAPDHEKGGYWVHQSARLRFELLDNRVALTVLPSYVFTTNGRTFVKSQDVASLAAQWGNKERNGAILRHLLMWSEVLTQGKKNGHIATGSTPIVIGRLPRTVETFSGIADDEIAVKALLKFTRAEMDLDVEDDGIYSFVNDEFVDDEEE